MSPVYRHAPITCKIDGLPQKLNQNVEKNRKKEWEEKKAKVSKQVAVGAGDAREHAAEAEAMYSWQGGQQGCSPSMVSPL